MKKISMIAAASVLALSVAAAMPAAASDVNINLQGTNVSQLKLEDTTQMALSAAIAVGSVSAGSDVASTAVNGVNMASVAQDIVQDADFLNGNLLLSNVDQQINDWTTQTAGSLAGSGAVSGGSTLSSTAANLANQASVTINVRQR